MKKRSRNYSPDMELLGARNCNKKVCMKFNEEWEFVILAEIIIPHSADLFVAQ